MSKVIKYLSGRKLSHAVLFLFILSFFMFFTVAAKAMDCSTVLGYVAIVEAYSSGNQLAPEFRKRGYLPIHVQTGRRFPPGMRSTFKRPDFEANLIHTADIDAIAKRVGKYSPETVIPGTESGVNLADQLSERLGVLSNGTELTEARRNKFLMGAALEARGLKAVDQHKSDKLEDILKWVHTRGKWPVVVKPLNSAASEDVYVCRSDAEVSHAYHTIMGKENRMLQSNSEVLVQEFLEGIEYHVNVVSRDGQHVVTDIWQYHKILTPEGNPIYEREELLPYDGVVQDQLRNYTLKALNALGIQHGPSHNEIMMTAEGPVAVDMAARLCGGQGPKCSGAAVGYSQTEVTVDAYVNTSAFFAKVGKPYPLPRHAMIVYVNAYQEGQVMSASRLPEMGRLASYFDQGDSSFGMHYIDGENVKRTTNFDTYVGQIWLVHEDPEVIQRDYEQIRTWEREGFFFKPRGQ